MTKTFEIYYDDLTDEAQKRYNELFGDGEDYRDDIFPIAMVDIEIEE